MPEKCLITAKSGHWEYKFLFEFKREDTDTTMESVAEMAAEKMWQELDECPEKFEMTIKHGKWQGKFDIRIEVTPTFITFRK